MTRHRRNIGYSWVAISGVILFIYGYVTQRATGDDLHILTAAVFYLCGAVQLSTLFVRPLQNGLPALLRTAFFFTAFVLRASVLLWVGSARSDRVGEILGAAIALGWGFAFLLFRALIEVTSEQ